MSNEVASTYLNMLRGKGTITETDYEILYQLSSIAVGILSERGREYLRAHDLEVVCSSIVSLDFWMREICICFEIEYEDDTFAWRQVPAELLWNGDLVEQVKNKLREKAAAAEVSKEEAELIEYERLKAKYEKHY
jgi:hypothetical protein